MPKDVAENFDRLRADADALLVRAVDNRPLPPVWIDRFQKISEAMGYTNVEGLTYMEFRMEFLRTYRTDHDNVSRFVEDLRAKKPQLFQAGVSDALIREFSKIWI